MSASLSKLLICALALSASRLPHTEAKSTPLWDNFVCADVQALTVEHNFYANQTRMSLEVLAKDNHPVGLYYMARQAYNSEAYEDALKILEQAAAHGLLDAYKSMAEIYSLNGQDSAALKAAECAKGLGINLTRQRQA